MNYYGIGWFDLEFFLSAWCLCLPITTGLACVRDGCAQLSNDFYSTITKVLLHRRWPPTVVPKSLFYASVVDRRVVNQMSTELTPKVTVRTIVLRADSEFLMFSLRYVNRTFRQSDYCIRKRACKVRTAITSSPLCINYMFYPLNLNCSCISGSSNCIHIT